VTYKQPLKKKPSNQSTTKLYPSYNLSDEKEEENVLPQKPDSGEKGQNHPKEIYKKQGANVRKKNCAFNPRRSRRK